MAQLSGEAKRRLTSAASTPGIGAELRDLLDLVDERAANFDRQHLPSPPPVAVVAGMQDNENWTTGAGIALAYDEMDPKVGHRSLKATVAASTTQTVRCYGSGTTDGLQPAVKIRGNFGVWLKIDDVSDLTTLQIQLFEDKTNTSDYHKVWIINAGDNHFNLQDGEWKLCWIGREGCYTTGSPTGWDTDNPEKDVEGLAFSIVTNTGGSPNIWFGGVLSQCWPKAYFTFTVDDTWASLYHDVLPAFDARGWKFTAWISQNYIGETNRCTLAQLNRIYASGHDLGCHRWNHSPTWTNATPVADVHAELSRSVQYWQDQGWSRGLDFLAHPANSGYSVGNRTADIIKFYFKHSRWETSWDGRKEADTGPPAQFNAWGGPPIPWHQYHLPSAAIGENVPIATLRTRLESCIANRHRYECYTHRVNLVGATSTNMTPTYWARFLGLLDEKVEDGVLEVISMSQWQDMVYNNPNWDYVSTGVTPASGYGALAQLW